MRAHDSARAGPLIRIIDESSINHLAGGASETGAAVIADRGITGAEIPCFDPKNARGSIIGAMTLNSSPEFVRDSTGVQPLLIIPLALR
jgi:hypothetical protein